MQNIDTERKGLIHAFRLDGGGGGERLAWEQLPAGPSNKGLFWIHLDFTSPDAQQWLREESGLETPIAEALLSDETRPRVASSGGSILLSLRGVNMNPGADPEDMVSIRLWIEPGRIISTRRRQLLTVRDIVTAIENGHGPRSQGDFLVDLLDGLVSRLGNIIDDIEDRIAAIEEESIVGGQRELRNDLLLLRRQTISLRRHLAPQREALSRFYTEKVDWLTQEERIHLREAADRLIRYVEDLDSVRERAALTQEEITNRLSDQMNQRMYVLSIVAAVFLPLGFLTGLLGINVGGIPGAEYPGAFWVFILILIAVVALQTWVFRKKHWF